MRTKRLGHFYEIRSRFSQYLLPKTQKVKKTFSIFGKRIFAAIGGKRPTEMFIY
jgi:hypothetical protein